MLVDSQPHNASLGLHGHVVGLPPTPSPTPCISLSSPEHLLTKIPVMLD